MRVAFLVPSIMPYRVTFFQKLASAAGVHLRVFQGRQKTPEGRRCHEGQTECEVETFDVVRIGTWGGHITYYVEMTQAVQAFDPDVVIFPDHCSTFNYWQVMSWANRNGRRVVIWVCGWEGNHTGVVHALRRHVLRRFCVQADLVLAYGTKAQTYSMDMGVPPEKVRVAYNGIEIDHLETRREDIMKEGRRLRAICPAKWLFLYVGGLIQPKRVDLLLRAFRQLNTERSDAELWIVGDGPLRRTLEKMTHAMRITGVTFWGEIIGGVDNYFAAADCFVLPGAGGLALNQAMYWGLPCIVSRADGTEEDLIVDGVTGFRFAPKDCESLCAAMKAVLCSNSLEIEKMGSEARETIVTRSNVNVMVQTFIAGLQGDTVSEGDARAAAFRG